MNDLSWMIYLIEIAGNLSEIFGFLIFVGFILAAIASFIIFVIKSDDLFEDEKKKLPHIKKYVRNVIIFLCFVTAMHVFVPSKKTMYMIAASQMGEKALNSETGNDVLDILKQRIKIELKKTKKELEKKVTTNE